MQYRATFTSCASRLAAIVRAPVAEWDIIFLDSTFPIRYSFALEVERTAAYCSDCFNFISDAAFRAN